MPPSPAVVKSTRPPKWIKPQLTRLVEEAPAGGGWVHEIKYDATACMRALTGETSSCSREPGSIGRTATAARSAIFDTRPT